MKLVYLLGLGPWKCPLCGAWACNGFWFRQHLQGMHRLSPYRASRFMVTLCERLPVYRNFVVPQTPFSFRKSAIVQADLFDTKVALVN